MRSERLLNIHSIFESISGEAGFFPQGTWCTFIRLQGCNLRCAWCDTVDAQPTYPTTKQSSYRTVGQIAEVCLREHVLITGGEPLIQRAGLMSLIRQLKREGHQIQVETNGTQQIPQTSGVGWVVDYKLPSTNMQRFVLDPARFISTIINKSRSIIKFVVDPNSNLDIHHMIRHMRKMASEGYQRQFIVSPLHAQGEYIQRIVETRGMTSTLLDRIIFSVQIHKLLEMK